MSPLSRLASVTAALVMLTGSFDVFLVVQAGGNFRFCQLAGVLLFLLACIRLSRGYMVRVLGFLPLSIWFICQVLFIPNTDFWPKSVGYCLWLLLNILLVVSFTQLFSSVRTLLRWYLYSFAAIACFGIIQFTLPLLGVFAPFIQQWWIPGQLPRVNAFSYEPSYFATYMLIGFVLAASLRRQRSTILPPRRLLVICVLTGTGVVLSSSRMGILFLAADIVTAQFRPWFALLSEARRLRLRLSYLKALGPSLAVLSALIAIATATAAYARNNPAVALMFLNGTGLSDTAAHSVIQRENAFNDTLQVFAEHPFIGRSLGGVSAAIANVEGQRIHSFDESKDFEGMSTFAEVLAASGILGIIPFICFLFQTIVRPLQLARCCDEFHATLLKSLVRALVFAWAILQFNQNVLRPYLWTHIALLCAVYAVARRTQARTHTGPAHPHTAAP